MSKADVVAAQKAAIVTGQDLALQAGLEAVYDQAVVENPGTGGGLTQADVDAAVAAAIGPFNDQITALNAQITADAQALSDAQAKAQSDLAALQAALNDVTAKEQVEAQAVLALQSSIAAVQASLDTIKGLVLGTPAPLPSPDPAP